MIHLHKRTYAYLEEINEGILRRLPAGAEADASVLDVGCGSGALAEAIQKKGYQVWGIELNEQAAEAARARGVHRVIQGDITSLASVRPALGDMRFDYLVFSDVLEHLYDPFTILTEYASLLKPGGRVLVSVPNALVWSNRLAFLLGRFEYADTGVMDRTHIRFFTVRSAKRLVAAGGFHVRKVDFTPFGVRALLPLIKRLWVRQSPQEGGSRRQLIDSPLYRFYQRFVGPVEYALMFWWKSLFAFRIIIEGEKTSSH